MFKSFISIYSSFERKIAIGFISSVAVLAFAAMPLSAQSNVGAFDRGFLGGVVVAAAPGQSWRVSTANIQPVFGDGSVRAVRAHVRVFDGRGNVLLQTDQAEIRPGAFHTFEIRRQDLGLPGDPRTGRLEIKMEVVFVSSWQHSTSDGREFPTTLELVDEETGKTLIGLLLPAVQKIRVD